MSEGRDTSLGVTFPHGGEMSCLVTWPVKVGWQAGGRGWNNQVWSLMKHHLVQNYFAPFKLKVETKGIDFSRSMDWGQTPDCPAPPWVLLSSKRTNFPHALILQIWWHNTPARSDSKLAHMTNSFKKEFPIKMVNLHKCSKNQNLPPHVFVTIFYSLVPLLWRICIDATEVTNICPVHFSCQPRTGLNAWKDFCVRSIALNYCVCVTEFLQSWSSMTHSNQQWIIVSALCSNLPITVVWC